jgi:hypothetical protein
MKLSNNTIAEIDNYFANQKYCSRYEMTHYSMRQFEDILVDCGFVYVSEKGQVIHKNRFCSYAQPVHIEQAIKHGYKSLCKKCAIGTRVEDLFWERMNKLKEK